MIRNSWVSNRATLSGGFRLFQKREPFKGLVYQLHSLDSMASLTVTQADLGLSPSHRIVVSLIVGNDYSVG
jgi:hypothetical protein